MKDGRTKGWTMRQTWNNNANKQQNAHKYIKYNRSYYNYNKTVIIEITKNKTK